MNIKALILAILTFAIVIGIFVGGYYNLNIFLYIAIAILVILAIKFLYECWKNILGE